MSSGPNASTAAPAPGTKGPGGLTSILLLPFLPLAWIFKRMVFRVAEHQGNQVASFTSFSSLIYTWPVMAIGYLGYAMSGHMSPALLGWTWLIVILFTLVVLGTDISRNSAVVWALVIGLILAIGALVNAKYSIPVLGQVYGHFASLGVAFNPGIALALAELLTIIIVVVIAQSVFDGHHEISSREVTHRHFLRTSESWPLAMNRVRLDWPDLLEMLVLFGAGHLVIIDQDRKEIMRIPNIPFLWFFRDEINSILDVMATTTVDPKVAAHAAQE